MAVLYVRHVTSMQYVFSVTCLSPIFNAAMLSLFSSLLALCIDRRAPPFTTVPTYQASPRVSIYEFTHPKAFSSTTLLTAAALVLDPLLVYARLSVCRLTSVD
jgi:hypothetical protein